MAPKALQHSRIEGVVIGIIRRAARVPAQQLVRSVQISALHLNARQQHRIGGSIRVEPQAFLHERLCFVDAPTLKQQPDQGLARCRVPGVLLQARLVSVDRFGHPALIEQYARFAELAFRTLRRRRQVRLFIDAGLDV